MVRLRPRRKSAASVPQGTTCRAKCVSHEPGSPHFRVWPLLSQFDSDDSGRVEKSEFTHIIAELLMESLGH